MLDLTLCFVWFCFHIRNLPGCVDTRSGTLTAFSSDPAVHLLAHISFISLPFYFYFLILLSLLCFVVHFRNVCELEYFFPVQGNNKEMEEVQLHCNFLVAIWLWLCGLKFSFLRKGEKTINQNMSICHQAIANAQSASSFWLLQSLFIYIYF